jgi:hypothetical protein
MMWEYTKSYFQESSIHGFWYLSNERARASEKILWAISMVFSFICCGLLTFEIGLKYQEDALVTYKSDVAIPVIDVSIISDLGRMISLFLIHADFIRCCDLLPRSFELLWIFRLQPTCDGSETTRNFHRKCHSRTVCLNY